MYEHPYDYFIHENKVMNALYKSLSLNSITYKECIFNNNVESKKGCHVTIQELS